jgi:cysteine-rich repeat protein
MRKQGSVFRKLGILVVVGLAVGSLAEFATAHFVRYGGSLTVTFRSADNVFKGRVSSPRDACERGRTVVVFRVAAGPDQKIGSARTDSVGRWRLTYNAPAGDYYAKVLRKDIGPGAHRHICRGVVTSSFAIPPRCGNGWVEEGEPCDDGNTVNGDGCDSNCQVEGLIAQLAAKEPAGGLKASCAAHGTAVVVKSGFRPSSAGRIPA